MDDLIEADRCFGKATAEKGLEGWLSYFDKDVTIFPAGSPAVSGIEMVKEHYHRTGFNPSALRWEPMSGVISSSCDLGYTWGNWEIKKTDDDGKEQVYKGKYLTVWKLQADNSWKVVADIGTN